MLRHAPPPARIWRLDGDRYSTGCTAWLPRAVCQLFRGYSDVAWPDAVAFRGVARGGRLCANRRHLLLSLLRKRLFAYLCDGGPRRRSHDAAPARLLAQGRRGTGVLWILSPGGSAVPDRQIALCRISRRRRSSRWKTRGSSPRRARRSEQDRDGRGIAGDQLLAWRPDAGFDSMLERAHAVRGSFGVFATYEGEHYRVAATAWPPAGIGRVRQRPRSPSSLEACPSVSAPGEDTVQIPDLPPRSEHRTPGLVAMIEFGKARTALWVGLRKDGVRTGSSASIARKCGRFPKKKSRC